MAAVKFRGFDSRTGLARWGLAAVAVGIVVGGTAPAAVRGLATVVDANPDALVWLFERLFAWIAYIAVAGSVIYGLLLSTKLLDAIAHRPISFSLHQDLAAFGLGLAGIHGMLLGLDHSVPFSMAQILVPGLAPHAPVAVAFGQVALYLMAAVTASFYLRKRIGQRAWRMFHYVTFLAFAGATFHGIASGSDSNAPWAEAIYLASAVLVLFLLTYRIAMSMAARREARREAVSAAAGTVAALPPARRVAVAPVDGRPVAPTRPISIRDGAPLRRDTAA
jgi:sulfoxide reductase heme-binding subunit YedZ